MPEGVEELLIVENLDGFTKENADTRMVKYLLEITQVCLFVVCFILMKDTNIIIGSLSL